MTSSPAVVDTLDRATALSHDIEAFIKAPETEPGTSPTFDQLALRAIRLQAAGLPGYQRLFEARGIPVESLHHWQDAPPIPSRAFQELPLTLLPVERVFRSSGTLGGADNRSEHHHGNLHLYRLIIDATFPAAVLGQPCFGLINRVPILSLIPPISQVSDSSLGFMTQEVVHNYGSQDSLYAFSEGKLDFRKALHWLRDRKSDDQHPEHPTGPVVLTTAVALWELLRAQQDSGTGLRWPTNTTIMETGGFKTLRLELNRDQLLQRLTDLTGVPSTRVVREYGMTELTSQAYSQVLQGGDPNCFWLPAWVRARALDPVTMRPVDHGALGMLNFLDLGNIGSAASLLTEDLGTVDAGGRSFQLHGRAADAQLRGCSLATESLLA